MLRVARENAVAVAGVRDGAVGRALDAGHGDGAGGDVVEDAAGGGGSCDGVACGAGFVLLAGEVVEDVVGVALAAAGLLVDERKDAGEGGGGDGGAAVAGEVVGGSGEAAGLAVGVRALLADDVEGAEEACAGEERDIGGIADAVGRDAGAGLP